MIVPLSCIFEQNYAIDLLIKIRQLSFFSVYGLFKKRICNKCQQEVSVLNNIMGILTFVGGISELLMKLLADRALVEIDLSLCKPLCMEIALASGKWEYMTLRGAECLC
jgi:hypothetical protein